MSLLFMGAFLGLVGVLQVDNLMDRNTGGAAVKFHKSKVGAAL